jgi:hypothetical protein
MSTTDLAGTTALITGATAASAKPPPSRWPIGAPTCSSVAVTPRVATRSSPPTRQESCRCALGTLARPGSAALAVLTGSSDTPQPASPSTLSSRVSWTGAAARTQLAELGHNE